MLPLSVQMELTRGMVGYLDQRRVFRSLFPWCIRELCRQCGHRELFLFNRFEAGEPKYVAMESGHDKVVSELAPDLTKALA